MPITPTYPGVYIEELPSGVRTITGVATSITAFIGRAKKGKLDDPVLVQSFADYERKFGGLWEDSTMSYAVQQYFLHGGRDALIIRVINGGAKATISIPLTMKPKTKTKLFRCSLILSFRSSAHRARQILSM
jgi:phage tail sheath protein FI